jgi:hypothetical protein
MGSSEATEIMEKFKAILLDARDSGPEVLRAWLREPEKFLRETRYSLPIHDVLRRLSLEEQEKALAVADYAVRSSFAFLLKYLEEGEAAITFNLTVIDESTGAKECVIGEGVYNDLADFVR